MRLAALLAAAVLLTVPGRAGAAFTDTAPAGVFLVDERIIYSVIRNHWNNDGELGPLLEPIERYEPGGGLQGTITTDAEATYTVLLSLIGYGITDDLTALVGIPVILRNTVEPHLGWEPGDYSAQLGRPYSEADFWEWAGSMGQPKPGPWSGNEGKLSDIVLGARWRFDSLLPGLEELGLATAVTVMGALPTGDPPDPEEIVATGSTSWNLHTQGELGLHLSAEQSFPRSLDDRLVLGVDIFYEAFLPRRFPSSTGKKHPLLLNHRPYVGDTYEIDPGDFAGVQASVEITAVRGPILSTWLAKGDRAAAELLPPLLKLTLQYNFTYVGQSDWTSDSALWDWQQEKMWRPGYKNIVYVGASVSLLRLGVPLMLYGGWRSIALLPSKNCRAPTVYTAGMQIPLKFW